MHIFLDSHPQSPYGIRFWAGKSETEERIHSYPLYAVAKPILEQNDYLREATKSIMSSE